MNDRRLKKRGSKNGRDVWTARVPLPRDADGKRRQHRFTFNGNRKDAEAKLVLELAQISSGDYIEADRTTFGQYVRAFLDGSKTMYANKTWERLNQLATGHVIPKLGDVPLQKLTASHLTRAYADWREAGLSGQTVLHHHRFIHRVLAQALDENRVRRNAAHNKATAPKAPRREMRFLSADEIARLLTAVEGSAFAPLVMLALASGARRGELVGAKWEDLDLARGTFAIRRSLEQTSHGVREKSPKNGRSRVVQLPATAVDMLRELRLDRGRTSDSVPIGYLFPDPENGGSWTPHKVTDGFRDLARKAGLVTKRERPTTRAGRRAKVAAPKLPRAPRAPGVTLHTLRHTCASLLLAQGVHPKVVQEMLGHSTVAITMDLYSHVTPSLQTEAAQRLDAILGPSLAAASGRGA